jgi:hypothetical protein
MDILHKRLSLPSAFCWSRFGTEAGEGIDSILKRKESERRANDGLFLWGIGNSVAPGLQQLITEDADPEVLFSPIRSRPRQLDISPPHRFRWSAGETLAGERFEIPETIKVTSGAADPASTRHYALVCAAEQPLQLADHGSVNFNQLRNISSGRSLGASQVTAIVRHSSEQPTIANDYLIALRAKLVFPYFLRLREAVLEHPTEPLIAA